MTPDLREKLELAAKACGYTVHGSINQQFIVNFPSGLRGIWNPPDDSADCAGMKAALRIDDRWGEGCVVACHEGGAPARVANFKDHNNDPQAAWRYAVLCVAAELGRRMKS